MEEIKYAVITVIWNESHLLPHFLKHYATADRIFVLDNESDDDSLNILKEYPNVEVHSFSTHGTLDVKVVADLRNSFWLNNKNYDYLIVQDLDEFLFFPAFPNDIKSALYDLKQRGITIVKASGYDMFCSDEEFDNVKNSYLSSSILKGKYNLMYNKCTCFSPKYIESMNFGSGGHDVNPQGHIVYDYGSAIIMHFKYVGKNYIIDRYKKFNERVSKSTKESGFAQEYWVGDYLNRLNAAYNNCNSLINTKLYPNHFILDYNNKKCIIDIIPEYDNEILKQLLKENIIVKNIGPIIYSYLLSLLNINIIIDNRIQFQHVAKINGWTQSNITNYDILLNNNCKIE